MASGASDLEGVRAAVEAVRGGGKTVAFTNGCFDLLHPGHVRSLQAAAELADVLVVGLNSDRSVRALKGAARPILPAAERAELLRALRCVDHVVEFDGDTPLELLRALAPDVYVKGSDWRDRPLAEAEVVRAQGGEVVFVDLLSGYSTTALVERIRALPWADGE